MDCISCGVRRIGPIYLQEL